MSKTITFGKFYGGNASTAIVLPCEPILKGNADLCFLSFDNQIGDHVPEKVLRLDRARNPRVGVAYAIFVLVAFLAARKMAADGRTVELILQHLNQGCVAVGNFDPENVPCRIPTFCSNDCHTAVCIKNTSDVTQVEHGPLLSAYDGMVVNSVELRCPARKGAEGQYRAKQERDGALGVCNEQVPPSKEKVCSVLTGNRERAAEMTAPAMTNERYCRHQYRVKASNKKGDRQCPSGRAYFLRNDDTYFMVDPRFVFKWTGDLTYPDQMAFTRLCGLRFFLKTDRRMFQAVIDGITA